MWRNNGSRARKASLPVLMVLSLGGTALALEAGGASTAVAADHSRLDVVLLVLYVLLALVFSFLCSVAEAVLLSITPSFVAGLREVKPRLGALLERLRQEKVDRSLAAILTLNTIAHTVGAIGAGAQATAVFGSDWMGLFSAAMTLMILFLSEIIPKTLGAVFWRRLAWPSAQFVRLLIGLLFPLIWLSEGVTRLIARRRDVHVFDRQEFVALADLGQQAGQLDERESRIIRNLFRLASLTTRDIMTPRTVMYALQRDSTVSAALAARPDAPFSRIPLYGRDLDDITGFILKDELLLAQAQGRGDEKLATLQRDIATVTGDMRLSALLELLLDKRQHVALVAGDYGGTKGLVSLEDVVETLLGMEIVDEVDRVEDMQALARQQWQKRARALGLQVGSDLQVNPELQVAAETAEPPAAKEEE